MNTPKASTDHPLGAAHGSTCHPPLHGDMWDGQRYRCQRCGTTDAEADLMQCHSCGTMICPGCTDMAAWNRGEGIICISRSNAEVSDGV